MAGRSASEVVRAWLTGGPFHYAKALGLYSGGNRTNERLLSWRVTCATRCLKGSERHGSEAGEANAEDPSSESIAAIKARNCEILTGTGKKGVGQRRKGGRSGSRRGLRATLSQKKQASWEGRDVSFLGNRGKNGRTRPERRHVGLLHGREIWRISRHPFCVISGNPSSGVLIASVLSVAFRVDDG